MKSVLILLLFSLFVCADNTAVEPKKKVTIHSILESKKCFEGQIEDQKEEITRLKEEIISLKKHIEKSHKEHEGTFKKNMMVVMFVVAASITFSLLSFIFVGRYKNRMEVKFQEALFMINGEKEKIDRFLNKNSMDKSLDSCDSKEDA